MLDSEKLRPCSGICLVDKPAGLTSRAIVNRIQRDLRQQWHAKIKCGHAGTLDPMATGLLVVCTGLATKLVPVIHEFDKAYTAGFTLGRTSDTEDATGEVVLTDPGTFSVPDRKAVQKALQGLTGQILQRPPAWSALKVAGQRAYDLARQGHDVTLHPRPITVDSIRLLRYAYPILELVIVCSSGTYIRSIGRDLGDELGCGAVMHSLVRTRIGSMELTDADAFPDQTAKQTTWQMHDPGDFLNHLPRFELNDEQKVLLRDGKSLLMADAEACARRVAVDERGNFIATLVCACDDGNDESELTRWKPEINWAPELYRKSRR